MDLASASYPYLRQIDDQHRSLGHAERVGDRARQVEALAMIELAAKGLAEWAAEQRCALNRTIQGD